MLATLPASSISTQVGDEAPDFFLSTFKGEALSLNDLKGSIVILVYWKPDQRRSITTMKDIQDIYSSYKKKGVEIIGITADVEKRDSILGIIKNSEIDFPILLDPDREIYGNYGIRVYPSTVMIDREGTVSYTLPGHALTYKVKIEGNLRYMLGEIDKQELTRIVSPVKEIKDEERLAAERRYNLAVRFTETGMVEQAIKIAELSVKSSPDIAKSHILLGFLFLETEEPERAFEEFNRALEIDPLSHDAKTGLGGSLLLKGEIDRAIEVLLEAVSSNPNPQMTFYELGRAYELKGEKNKSVEMYRKVLDKIVENHILPSSVSRCE